MEIRHLRFFVTLADEGHYGRAAERLYVTQPALSQAITRLEGSLGFALFDRSRRGTALSEEGRIFLPEARRMLDQDERATKTADRIRRGLQGQLAIGAVSSATYGALPRAIREFRAIAGKVDVSLFELGTVQQVEQLSSGRLDVGFIRPDTDPEGLEVMVVTEERMIAAIPAGHPLADRGTLTLSDLRDEPLLLLSRDFAPGYSNAVLKACAELGFSPKVIAHQSDHVHTMVSMVSAGFGIAVVPAGIARFQLDDVVYQPLGDSAPVTTLRLAWQEANRSRVLDTFIATVQSVFQVATP